MERGKPAVVALGQEKVPTHITARAVERDTLGTAITEQPTSHAQTHKTTWRTRHNSKMTAVTRKIESDTTYKNQFGVKHD